MPKRMTQEEVAYEPGRAWALIQDQGMMITRLAGRVSVLSQIIAAAHTALAGVERLDPTLMDEVLDARHHKA